MSQDPFAGQADQLITGTICDEWVDAAETCVLNRTGQLRIYGGLPKCGSPLAQDDRRERLASLLRLWADGCFFVIDEELFADILQRRHAQTS